MNFHSKIKCLIIEVLEEMSKNVEGLRDKIITQFSFSVHVDSRELFLFMYHTLKKLTEVKRWIGILYI